MTQPIRRVQLHEVVRFNPRRPELQRDGDAPTTFVPMRAVDEIRGVVGRPEVRPFNSVARGYTYFAEGDVLFSKITPCMQNGKHAVARGLIDGIGFGTTEFHVLRPEPALRSDWLLHFLRQPSVLKAAERSFQGSVGLQRVPESFLATLPIPLPSLEDQDEALQGLALALEETRTASSALQVQLDLASVLPASLFREEFGMSLPLSTEANADTGAKQWHWHRLVELARLESGHTPSRRHPEWWGGDVPWLALPDIRKLHGKVAMQTTENTNALGLANSSARLLPVGTVCLCRDASIGYVTMLGRPMATSQHFCNWICDPARLDPEFLMYALMASHDYMKELGSGSVLRTIYMPTIQSFHICAPGIDEQRRIARRLRDRLSEAEALRNSLQARLADIEQLPQHILASAFETA